MAIFSQSRRLTDDGGGDCQAGIAEVGAAPLVLEGQPGHDQVEGSQAVRTPVRDADIGEEAGKGRAGSQRDSSSGRSRGSRGLSVQLETVRGSGCVLIPLDSAVTLLLSDTIIWRNIFTFLRSGSCY